MNRLGKLSVVGLLAVLSCAPAGPFAAAEDSSSPSPASLDAIRATGRQIAEFKQNTAALLKTNPVGGIQLAAMVKALVIGDPTLVGDLLSLSQLGNNLQAAAIGAGIGQAVKALSATDKTLADAIAAKVAAGAREEVLAGYAIGTSDNPTYAVTGGPSAVGAGSGGPVNSASNSGGGSARPSQTAGSSTSNTGASTPSFGGSTVSCTQSASPSGTC
jgi:hypothetical protein